MTDFNDLAVTAGPDVLLQQLGRAKSATPINNPNEWPDPLRPGTIPVQEIPASILPTWAGAMAQAVAESTQTSPTLAVMLTVSILATVLQRRYEVKPYGEDDDYSEPLAVWTLTGLGSGNRKTAVINSLAAPLVYWEKLERDRMRSEIARVTAARAVGKKRIEKLLKDASNADNDDSRARIQEQIQKEEEAMPAEVRAPRLYTGDCTAERLQGLLVEHGERMAVLSDESGIFLIMAGIYSGGIANLDVFLQGHAGTPMRVDRAERSAHIDKPALSFGLALQPGVLADVASSRRFRDSGLLARFLFAMPESNVGKRDVRRRVTIPEHVKAAYARGIFSLLEQRPAVPGNPRVIPFTDAALECWLDFAEVIEEQQGDGGKLESIADWSSKLPGAAARIAALLELAEVGLHAESVSEKSAQQAVKLCGLLIDHARAAFGLLGADATEADASAIVKWLGENSIGYFKRSTCQKAMEGRFRTVDKLKKALERLVECDVLREEKLPNKGAPPSVCYRVNPKCHST
ncbi:MAG: YfjI family protein [Pseudomonadota bacterium]